MCGVRDLPAINGNTEKQGAELPQSALIGTWMPGSLWWLGPPNYCRAARD
jgi:hypothetical protein